MSETKRCPRCGVSFARWLVGRECLANPHSWHSERESQQPVDAKLGTGEDLSQPDVDEARERAAQPSAPRSVIDEPLCKICGFPEDADRHEMEDGFGGHPFKAPDKPEAAQPSSADVGAVSAVPNTLLERSLADYAASLRAENEKLRGERDRQYEFNAGQIAKLAAAEQRIAELTKILEEISEPIKFMRQRAEAQGGKLDGRMAVELSEDANFLKSIAREALKDKP